MEKSKDMSSLTTRLKMRSIEIPDINIRINNTEKPSLKDINDIGEYMKWSLDTLKILLDKIDILELEAEIINLIRKKMDIDAQIDKLEEQVYLLTKENTPE